MRIGFLSFGPDRHPDEVFLAEALRERDVDVAAGGSAVASGPDAAREAKRLARADCDGVVFVLWEGVAPAAVAEAALHLAGVPLLLSGPEAYGALLSAAGALEEAGAAFDRLPPDGGVGAADAPVEAWLRENARAERHRGLEAARRLYGQRLYVPADAPGPPDAALWMHQFGVVVAGAEEAAADFGAPDGDAYGALTTRLLEACSGASPAVRVPLAGPPGGDAPEDASPATFARISRRAGRFRCLLLRGELAARRGAAVARWDCPYPRLLASAASPWLHAVPGDHVGAMRAACQALDVEPVILRGGDASSP